MAVEISFPLNQTHSTLGSQNVITCENLARMIFMTFNFIYKGL